MKRFGGDKKYLYWGVTAFLVIASCILLYLLIQRWGDFSAGMTALLRILSPFVWGVVIAYLLRPMMRFYETWLLEPLGCRLFPKKESRVRAFSRVTGIILSEASLMLIVFFLLRLVLPQLYSSVESIVVNSESYYGTIVTWGSKLLEDYPQIEQTFVTVLGQTSDTIVQWIRDTLLPQMTGIITNITSGVYHFVRGIYYVSIGIIASVYMLYNKENVSTGAKKLLYSVFSPARSKKILDATRFSDDIFMGFVSGKIVDSAIIGVLCYICCLIMKMPYAILVSVIVGITNVIPFFGPFIGAIPSAFIILMIEPIKALEFVIFILLLQQFDGNILGPKILGESTGINGFWVMFSIIFGAGLFGFAGMLLGVPVFVVIYTGIQRLVERRLEKSGLPTETASYATLDYIDPDNGQAVERPPEPTREERRAKAEALRAERAAKRKSKRKK